MRKDKKILRRHTRGEWKSGELKGAVLAVLRVYEREVESGIALVPCLTAERIALLTGANLGSLRTLLKRWVLGRHIKRFHTKPYGYSITPRGNVCFDMLVNGYISKRHGRWVQVNMRAVIRRLPGFRYIEG